MNFTDKAFMVTGAASGIGEACVRRAGELGASILLCDIDVEKGEALTQSLQAEGVDCRFHVCNVSAEQDVETAVRKAIKYFGGLDCAINNAGIVGPACALEDYSLEDWNRVIAVNLTSVFLCVKHQLRVMKPRQAGAIVNVASGAGLMGTPNLAAYCASKHGVLGITRTAVAENPQADVRINAILPGSTRTPMLEQSMAASDAVSAMIMQSIPCGRLAEPTEVAEAALWLCSDGASYINGHSLVVDNGGMVS
ncbi:SDR family NAD(P)-dependent oxidoreductase [Litorivivens sp.]|uniref:SDR family NAD(P)-dependent oxidoreductase n=2 Tax=Litorivivens sp. TaxID=2020868 RepID=UPI00356A5BE1